MDALHVTTTTINPDNNMMIDINLSYNSQEYPEINYKPYSVYWFDWFDFDNDEANEIGDYYTPEEAQRIYDKIVNAAEKYSKSLLRSVYSFSDYLTFSGITKGE